MRCLRLPARAAVRTVADALGIGANGWAGGESRGVGGGAAGGVAGTRKPGGQIDDGAAGDSADGDTAGWTADGGTGGAGAVGGGDPALGGCADTGGTAAGVRFEFADWLDWDKYSRL